ncbi:MAG: hypothetical protein ACLU80_10105 [Dorea sp.]
MQYDRSYAKSGLCGKNVWRQSIGQVLSALYAELRGAIAYVYEQKMEYLAYLYMNYLLKYIISLRRQVRIAKNVQRYYLLVCKRLL